MRLSTPAAGASWISIHNGGGVGIGYSPACRHGRGCRWDREFQAPFGRVLTSDPGMGILRHADAGYSRAIEFAKANKIEIPVQPTSARLTIAAESQAAC
jgi:urocanate hydratase